jgi:polysaccharide chain length determinant protein (PEP-CTERM system associated)
MVHTRELRFEDYVDILRRRWLALLILGTTMAGAGFAASYILPKRFTSRTTVLVDEPKVPENYVHPVVSEDLNQRLATMQEQILSRTQLEAIIERFNLFPKQRGRVPKEDLIARMRDAVVVEQIHTDAKTTGVPGFSIRFTGEDPHVAQAVCAEITSMFMGENLRAREQRAANTTEFLESQLDEAKRALEAEDQRLAEFKQQYVGQLPEQEQTNMSLLAGFTAQLEAANQSLSQAKQDKAYSDSILAQQIATKNTSSTSITTASAGKEELRLEDLRAELASLRARYTENHPDVVKLENQINDLTRVLKADQRARGPEPNQTASAPTPLESPEIQRLRIQQHALESLVIEKTAQQQHLQQQIGLYQSRVQLSPKVEEKYKDLTRDYQTALAFYNDLLAKKAQSAMATDLERSQQGEQFRILDPADLPEKPVFPNPVVFTVIGFVVGLMIGLAVAIIRAMLDTSIRTETDVKRIANLPVIGTISLIETIPAAQNWPLAIVKRGRA